MIMGWLRNLFGMPPPHRHRLVEGLGMFGDAFTCIDCGWSKYPSPVVMFVILSSEILPETEENIRLANAAMKERDRREEAGEPSMGGRMNLE